MSMYSALRFLAGCVISISTLLGAYVSTYWYLLTAFVALNLIQSAYTRWCPAVFIFRLLKLEEDTCAFTQGNQHRYIHLIAGALLSILLTILVISNFSVVLNLILVGFGLSLVQSAFSGWCPAIYLARRISQ